MKKCMSNVRAFASPSKYIQGAGEINHIKEYTDKYGEKVVFIIDGLLFDSIMAKLKNIYSNDDDVTYIAKKGEITLNSLDELFVKIGKKEVDIFIAIGGGKTIDTTKVIANKFGKPIIIMPTVASTDAPTSALSVIYTDKGEHSHEIYLKKNPDIILVDTKIISEAPVRLLVSGMGDAIATYFEARASDASNYENVVSEEMNMSFGRTLAAKAIAELCYHTLIKDGVKAKIAVEEKVVTEALENVVEANTLLSGIGFESNGVAAAHAISDGLTKLPQTAKFYHGERVAFGVIAELVMENVDTPIINEVLKFYLDVGLPMTLEDLGITEIIEDDMLSVADGALDSVIQSEPFIVTRQSICDAIIVANKIGRIYKSGKSLL